ncbi:MAG TPA: [LysW]-lysine hydrolase [Phycisphaerales bacterium]|nr:[LysW]-lysine hydrolase [Phycisphaerales bacterium]
MSTLNTIPTSTTAGAAGATDPLLQGGAAGVMPAVPARFLEPSNNFATQLLTEMVSIPSLSGEEQHIATYLAQMMRSLGFQAHVDESGSAVGIAPFTAAAGEPTKDIVLLGHMDTVPGVVPIRREGDLLYGRGSVDAKGPLATFVVAAARAKLPAGVRLVVIGATDEEGVSSRGARFNATQFRPDLCIIGEPSHWDGVTLGYKGRLLVEYRLTRACSHSAGPGPSAPELVSSWWENVKRRVRELNGERTSPFEIVQATLRRINTSSDGLYDQVHAVVSFRIPLHVQPDQLTQICRDEAEHTDYPSEFLEPSHASAEVIADGPEVAYMGPRDTAVVRAFTTTIRQHGAKPHLRVKTGTSDMNIVGPIWKCPIVAYGPGDSRLDHTPNEHISISEYHRAIEVLTAVIERVAREV